MEHLFPQFLDLVDDLSCHALIQHLLSGRGVQEDEEVSTGMGRVTRGEGRVNRICELERDRQIITGEVT